MSVKLGDVLSPDTNLYVQLFGEKGETSKIMLRPVGSSLNKFEKGRTYKFTVETVNIGRVSYKNAESIPTKKKCRDHHHSQPTNQSVILSVR